MSLALTALPATLKHYTGKAVPGWARYLHPEATEALLKLEKATSGLVYTDIWRPASVSLEAMKSKQGVQPPGFSGHNYGLSIDFAIDQTMAQKNWSFADLNRCFELYGWYGHRRTKDRGFEEWHFNYLGADSAYWLAFAGSTSRSWAVPIQKKIEALYGEQLKVADVPAALNTLGYRDVKSFQAAWGLQADGVAGPRTQQTIGFLLLEKAFKAPPVTPAPPAPVQPPYVLVDTQVTSADAAPVDSGGQKEAPGETQPSAPQFFRKRRK